MANEVDVVYRGTMFDGGAQKEIDLFLEDATMIVGQAGHDMVLSTLGRVLQNPTGFYESTIVVERMTREVVVHDSILVVYGPWLEGVGSRNKTTRFKGYFTFRKVTAMLKTQTTELVRPRLLRLMRELQR